MLIYLVTKMILSGAVEEGVLCEESISNAKDACVMLQDLKSRLDAHEIYLPVEISAKLHEAYEISWEVLISSSELRGRVLEFLNHSDILDDESYVDYTTTYISELAKEVEIMVEKSETLLALIKEVSVYATERNQTND